MRLTAILVLTACLQLFAVSSAHAQKQTITLSFKEAPLETVMADIRKQTGVDFMYDVEWLKFARKVTIDIKDVPLWTALDSVFANQPFTYAITGSPATGSIITIISKGLLQKPPPAPRKISDINGKVTNINDVPLEGATVIIKGTATGTTTDATGSFMLKDVSRSEILEVSYVGYLPLEIKASKIADLPIRLEINPLDLEAAVTTGYTTNTRRNTLGTSTKINSRDISNMPINNPLAALHGRVPGMVVTQRGGMPGAGFDVQIRGQRSIGTSAGVLPPNSPLFVIDGVPFLTSSENLTQRSQIVANSPFSTINPADIESIEILKDANATSIYGSLGANGVVLITTKKARQGKTMVDVKMYTGWGRVTQLLDYMNTGQYLEMRREALANQGLPINEINAPDLVLWDTTRHTDWKKILLEGSSRLSNAHIRLSGGSASTQFTASIGVNHETTVFPESFGKTLISASMQASHTSENKKLEYIMAASFGSDQSKLMYTDPTYYINYVSPNTPYPLDSNGKLVFSENGLDISNPYSFLKQPYEVTMERLTTSFKVNYKPFEWLQFRTNLGYSNIIGDEYVGVPIASKNPATNPTGEASFGQSKSRNWIVEPQVEYTQRLWKKGKLKTTIGTSFREQISKSYLTNGIGYTNDAVIRSPDGAGSRESFNEFKKYRIHSIYGVMNFSWDHKYLAEITGREDGSSRFGPRRQFGHFGSVAAGWIFSNEKFMNNLPWITYGKFRASYGSTGNDQIGDYEFFDTWLRTTYDYQITGYRPTKLYNNEFRWERNKSIDISLDLRLFKDKYLLSAVWNQSKTTNQLISYQLPSQSGFTTVLRNSPGSVRNRNIEIELTAIHADKTNFKWSTSLNIAIHKNRLLYFPDLLTSSYGNTLVINQPLNLVWGYRTTGVNPITGMYRILDRNGNVIDIPNGVLPKVEDMSPIGSHAPNYYGGLQNSIQVNNWKLDFLFQFAKQKGANNLPDIGQYAGFTQYNMPIALINRWRKPGDVAPYQQYTPNEGTLAYKHAYYYGFSEDVLVDASFIRLKNISVSYSLSPKLLKKLKINSCSVFMQGQNILTISSYKGSNDPESGTINPRGLPPLKIIVFGIQASL
jgi:TonB-dependent starch-binding outer membrane protein SusC